jgi:hypothetical protein
MYDQETIPPPSSNGQTTVLSPAWPTEPFRPSSEGLEDRELPRLLERYAERQALSVLRAANFTHCLLQNHLAAEIEVRDARGNPLTLRGKDLYNEVAWRKFLSTTPITSRLLCSLIEGTEEITRRFRSFLLTAYTPRYRSLVHQDQLVWFRQVTRLVVVRRIMETKYEQSVLLQREIFADAWVGSEMRRLMALNTLASEIAKAIHHIVKAPREHATDLIEQLYHVHARQVLSHIHQQASPLPPLPAGTLSPGLFLAGEAVAQEDREEGAHAEQQ